MRLGTSSWCLALLLLAAGQSAAQCRVEGSARTEDGTALSGATVRLEVADQRVPLTATVGSDGRYRIENVRPGSWVRIVVQQEGRLVAQVFALVTQAVEPLDLVVRPSSSRIAGDWDLRADGGLSGAVVGTVRGADGLPIAGAHVTIADTTVAATTDSAGRYAFGPLRSGLALNLEASAPGYQPASAELIVPDEGRLDTNFSLDVAEAAGGDGTNLSVLSLSDDTSQATLGSERLSGLPSLGRRDVFRALEFLPGVSAASEASGELHVRGGTPGENLVTLDAFTLYPVARVVGPFSALNPDAIEGVRFSKSAVDAADGGRLGGVARLTGQSNMGGKPTGFLDVSLLGTRGFVSVPMGTRASFVVAARRSFSGSLGDRSLGVLTGTNGEWARERAGRYSGGDFSLTPSTSLQDVNGKLETRLTAKDRLSLTFYDAAEDANNSRDVPLRHGSSISVPGADSLPVDAFAQVSDLQSWTARGMGATWTRRWSPSAATTFSVGHSRTSTNSARASLLTGRETGDDYSFADGRAGSQAQTDANSVKDTTVRLVNTVTVGFGHALSFGGQLTAIDADYALQAEILQGGVSTGPSQLATVLSGRASGRLTTAFVQDSWRPFTKLTVSPGVRVTHYDLAATNYVEPRVSLTYQAARRFHLEAGWSLDHQQATRLRYEDRLQGDRELWALSDGSSLLVPRARQAWGGASVDVPGGVFEVQGYYKFLDDLALAAPRLLPGTAPDATSHVLHYGTGTAYGLEALLQKEWGRNTVWTAYTAGRSEYFYPTLEAAAFPASNDRQHELKVADSLRIAARWWVSGAWVVASGRPYTPATGVAEVWFPTGLVLNQVAFGEKNSDRLPAYHRLDLSTEREFRVGWFKSTLGVTVFNVYDRDNVRLRAFDVAGSTLSELSGMGRVVNVFLRAGF